jgi:hypothetical protein
LEGQNQWKSLQEELEMENKMLETPEWNRKNCSDAAWLDPIARAIHIAEKWCLNKRNMKKHGACSSCRAHWLELLVKCVMCLMQDGGYHGYMVNIWYTYIYIHIQTYRGILG